MEANLEDLDANDVILTIENRDVRNWLNLKEILQFPHGWFPRA